MINLAHDYEELAASINSHVDRVESYRRGEMTADEFRPVRLSHGLYYQLDHTSHLQRIKVPAGVLNAEQLLVIAEIAERWGRGVLHVTTRQDFQIHWVPLDALREMYLMLARVGISTRGACSDSVRNVTASPCAGTCVEEPFDVVPYALALTDYFLFHPLNITLPRKFKVSFTSCRDDEAQGVINDLGFYAHERGGERGFAVVAGGGLGPAPHLAFRIRDFLPEEDVLGFAEAVVRIQHRYGERKNRHKARMKFLVKRMGTERFREIVEAEFAKVSAELGVELRRELQAAVGRYRMPAPVRPAASNGHADGNSAHARWLRTNTRAQKQSGYRAAIVNLPVGDVTATQLRSLADLSGRFGNGTVRATNDQSLVLPFVAEVDLAALHEELRKLRLAEPNALHLSDVTSCPGADYCSLAVTRSMGVADRIRGHFAARADAVEELGRFRIKISGCPNSCGQHHVGDIGLTGMAVKGPDGLERPHCAILVGGSVGEDTGTVAHRLRGRFPEAEVPHIIERITDCYRTERLRGERFADFVRRVGVPRIQELTDRVSIGSAPEVSAGASAA